MIDLSKVQKRTTADIAKRIVQDIPDGAHVNLGIGQPMTISNYLPSDKEILLHSENGLLGMGPLAKDHEIDEELVNAGKQPVTMLPGASLCHHADSFVMIRGGHIDICVLGAFQVSVKGDIANWRTGDPKAIPAVGGAMDLALGGQGAPIVPMGERTLFSDYSLLLNIGGIANITRSGNNYIAFDICPANRVLNLLAARLGKSFDENGSIAATGKVVPALLSQLSAHPF